MIGFLSIGLRTINMQNTGLRFPIKYCLVENETLFVVILMSLQTKVEKPRYTNESHSRCAAERDKRYLVTETY